MPNVRPLNIKKYGISKHAFLCARSYCLQYDEWLAQLENEVAMVKSPQITGLPGAHNISDPTASAAERILEITKKMRNVEDAAWEASGKNKVLYQYLLEYVTEEGCTFTQMKQRGIPCERTFFYEMRRRFYYLLSKKI